MKIVEEELRAAGLNLSSTTVQRLAAYADEMDRWNKAVNLSALRGDALWRRLIIDPIRIGKSLEMSGVLADVGSGNGSPGIPLSLGCDFREVHLIEPRLKRASFLRHVVAKLGLKHVIVHRNRIEDFQQGTMKCDWVSLQAIEPTADILDSLKHVASATTRVVWITSKSEPPIESATPLEVSGMNMCGWIFKLDQT